MTRAELKDKGIDTTSLTGSSLSWTVYKWIYENISRDSRILEVGAGYGTKILNTFWEITSIEHDKNFIDIVDDVNYVYCPIKDGWYDIEAFSKGVLKEYKLVIVDGPVGDNRGNIINHIELFDPDSNYIVDDIHYKSALKIAECIRDRFHKQMEIVRDPIYHARSYAILT